MKSRNGTQTLRSVDKCRCLLLMLILALVGCSPGESVLPSVAIGMVADRSVGLVAPVPDPIDHELTEERQECFDCHAIGAVDALPIPDDHDEDVTLCTTCHAVWLIPAIAAITPPAIPHDIQGYETCLVCHKLGVANTPRVPDNHADLSSDMCQACHTSGTVGVIAEGPVVAAPINPHGLEVDTTCTHCHAGEIPGVVQFPDDHQDRTDDMCATCHLSATNEGVSVIEIPWDPHPPKGFSDCIRCHAEASRGVPAYPDNHQGRDNDICSACHKREGELP